MLIQVFQRDLLMMLRNTITQTSKHNLDDGICGISNLQYSPTDVDKASSDESLPGDADSSVSTRSVNDARLAISHTPTYVSFIEVDGRTNGQPT
jgi:hypothetical protein